MPETDRLAQWDSRSPDATLALGRVLGNLLRPGDVVALFGELGSGKTVLVRGVADGFGCRADEVHSPSFTLVNEYACVAPGRVPRRLAHFDLYRIGSDAELPGIGWDAYIGADLVLIEWAERAGAFLPRDRLQVRFTPVGAQHRRIGAEATGPRAGAVLHAWKAALSDAR